MQTDVFQSPFFIGASSGLSVAGIGFGWAYVSIPFLHRGVFRAEQEDQSTLMSAGFNPLSSSGRLQGWHLSVSR